MKRLACLFPQMFIQLALNMDILRAFGKTLITEMYQQKTKKACSMLSTSISFLNNNSDQN